jgi:ArsR family transcriptional regulator, virulence genes transcriptional regulator
MNVDPMRAKCGEAAGFLKSLANEHRLTILCELAKGERSVGELEAVVGLGQSALSQHLAKLRRRRLVRRRRQSRAIHYSLADPGVRKIIRALYAVYCGPRGRN